jgi:hypothetical protein
MLPYSHTNTLGRSTLTLDFSSPILNHPLSLVHSSHCIHLMLTYQPCWSVVLFVSPPCHTHTHTHTRTHNHLGKGRNDRLAHRTNM